ncbi:hypothetical protein BGZ57DRAFT_824293 [Hyaloscypha finlandica]|nr:hypothetical protein BGZ57DRAFT_824293 [Hyaloscypha finlandica]
MRSAYQEVDTGAKSAIAKDIDQNSSHGGRRTLNDNYESLSLFQSPGYDGNGRSAVGHVYDHAADEYAAPASDNLKDENNYAASLRTKSGEDEPSAKPRKLENLPSLCTPPSPQQRPYNKIPPADSFTVDPTLRSARLTRERLYKHWDSDFWNSQRQNREPDSQSFVDCARSSGAFGDTLEIFLQDYEGSSFDDKVEDVLDFCKGASLQDLQRSYGASGLQHTAWLDDRSCPTTNGIPGTREDRNPLTATQLYCHLSLPRFDLENMPDADRRLMYIWNMNPYHVLALAETARYVHVDVLRNAIWQHLTHRSSLKVTIPVSYKMFQLEFNLPYFRLSLAPEPASHTLSSVASAKQWTDLSFLKLSSPDKNTVRKLGIFEAHFSFVVCGWRENRWIAYAFDNTEPDAEDSYGRLFEESYDRIFYDDTEHPIWDPREYFLTVVEARVIRAADEWEALVRGIERRITKYVSHRRCAGNSH